MASDLETTIVEAASLSHVTSIATHPPPHPNDNDPSDTPRLPLVLYIARVPGSRDVFLTPIKPREKIVTAEDVQSSLYYIHVNCEEDYQDLHQNPALLRQQASEMPTANTSHREPTLPSRHPAEDSPARPRAPPTLPHHASLPHQNRQISPSRSKITRKPVGSVTNGSSLSTRRMPDLPVLPSRPLPRPPKNEEEEGIGASLHADNVRLLRRSDHSEENNPYARTYESTPDPLDPSQMPLPGSLTLIRRDPSSNAQWDVASVHDPPVREIGSAALLNPSAAKRTKRGGAPLYLDISNPAYLQFINPDRPASRLSISSRVSSDSDPAPDGVFRRRLYMPGSRYGEHSYGHDRRPGSNDSSNEYDVAMRRSMRHSADLSKSSAQPFVDRRSKGYTFTSPWDGRCEFFTGTTGKSLKCRHFLPSHQGGRVAEVSELRFNLPTSQSRSATALSEKRSSYFHRSHGRTHSTEDGIGIPDFIINEDGSLDLTLGQEKAGGGFGGKQAKLGKLIIHPEGLKMLDLLVAANLGLWWRAYERG